LFYYTCLGKKLGHIAEKAKQMIPDISKVIYQPKAGKKRGELLHLKRKEELSPLSLKLLKFLAL
jgi:hypothetical protein